MRARLQPEALAAWTQRLIAVPTENPPGEAGTHAACREVLAAALHAHGFNDIRQEGECLLAFAGGGTRTLYFSGHYDVVPAQHRAQFQPEIRGRNLFGRGASDMKGGLVAMMQAAAAARDEGLLEAGRIGLIFVPDEETAGPRGSRHLAACGLLGADGIGMVTPEPTGGVIWNASRGAITLRATMAGKAAHVGRQFEGRNAFERALPALQRLARLKAAVERRRTRCAIAPAAARHSILMLGGISGGGTNFNVTPESFSFTLDRRLNPEENADLEFRRLEAVLAGFTVEVLQREAAASTSAGTALAHSLARQVAADLLRA
ncbi:MAG: M20 family metallopeptidase [Terriglobales bacterium]